MTSATSTSTEDRRSNPGGFKERLQAFRERHAVAEIAVFFGAGFLFDVFTLDRIDSNLTIAQHAAYLLVLGGLLLYAQRADLGLTQPGRFVAWVWRFREDILHFLLGSLLSSFSLFYFKAASGFSAVGFMVAMFAVLVANELPRFRKLGPVVRLALYALCVTTFFSYVTPIVFGFLSVFLFLGSLVLALGVGYGMFALLRRWTGDSRTALKRVLAPFVVMQVILGSLYFLRVIPPIPLAAEKLGIYHDVIKEVDDATKATEFRLVHRKTWKFWQQGDQTFLKRPGDRVWVFAAVFAPTRFEDKVRLQWLRHEARRGWSHWGKPVVVTVRGGRERGFRTWSYLDDPEPGLYRAEVQTDDSRVIGSIRVEVVEDPTTEDRQFAEDRF